MAECRVRMPPLSSGELEAELVRSAGVPPTRRAAIEALLDSVEEAASSDEPVVVFIVGEWGEGKTAAWHAYVKPELERRGFETVEVRAGSLDDALSRASWIASPGWRLLAAIYAVLEGGGVPGDYREAAAKLASRKLAIFIDEVEDLVYREGGVERLLEGIHAVLDGEVRGLRACFYLAVSPTAYARITSWSAWRRLRRRVRVVELRPLTRSEAIDALLAMLRYACGGCTPVQDVRLFNAVVAASKGNLGALAAYTRRLLAAWARRGCEPLGARDVARILSEPVPAGLAAGGLDDEMLEKLGVDALLVVAEEPREGFVEAEACPADGEAADNVWLLGDASKAVLGGVWAAEAAELGWRVARCTGGRRVYALSPRLIARLFAEAGGLASFIADEQLRLQALRVAYRDSRLAARGLAALLCHVWRCTRCICELENGAALLEARLRGYRVRMAVLAPGAGRSAARVLSRWRPHVVISLGEAPVEGRVVELKLEPLMQLKLGALGYVASDSCRLPSGSVDLEKLGALASRLELDHGLVERLLEALDGAASLIQPPLRLPPGAGRRLLECVVRVAGLLVEADVGEVAERARSLCGVDAPPERIEHLVRMLAAQGAIGYRDGRVYVTLSAPERGVLEVLERLGGVARLHELEEMLVPEGVWDQRTRAWIHLLAWKGWVSAPLRLSPRSKIRLIHIDELRSSVDVERVPEWARRLDECGDEVCERAWLSAAKWLAEQLAARAQEEGASEAVGAAKRVEREQAQRVERVAAQAVARLPAAPAPLEEHRPAPAELRLLEARLLEALLAAPAALAAGRLEELAASIERAKRLARAGKVDDALLELSDALVTAARGPDAVLQETAKRLDPEGYQVIAEMVEGGYAARRALEKLVARSVAKLLERSLRVAEARMLKGKSIL